MAEEPLPLGQKIKEIRKQLKVTQSALGEITHTSRAVVNNIERGDQKPPIDFLVKFAEYSGVSLDRLLGVKRKSRDSSLQDLLQTPPEALTPDQIENLKEHLLRLQDEVQARDQEIAAIQKEKSEAIAKLERIQNFLNG